MRIGRKPVLQLLLAVIFAGVLLAVAPGSPAARLRVAVNYTYKVLVPSIAVDGVP